MQPNVTLHLAVGMSLFITAAGAINAATRAADASRADFFVAPSGSDDNPGTLEKPFASVACAQDAIRQLKRAAPNRDYAVMLRGGTYRLDKTVVFTTYERCPGNWNITRREDRWMLRHIDFPPGAIRK